MAAPPVEELIYSCMLADPSTRRQRLDELCTSYPEVADELRERFDRLVDFGLVSLGHEVDAPAAPHAALPESLGPFRITGILGRGGMGVVYQGTQPSLGDRPVAVKALLPDRIADPVSEARFVREGLLAAKLQHPNLCPVIDVGKDQGLVYLAMPLIEGESLASKLDAARRNGDTPESIRLGPQSGWRAMVALVEKLARALHEAHAKGLVHRDVKPGNILVRPDGEPVLLDFGLARELDDDAQGLTRSLDILGTPAYMAPEQADPGRRRSDARTDVYSLAATLFEGLTLRLPHEATSRAELLRRIASEPPARLGRHAPRAPRDLEVLLEVALDTDPDRRHDTAEAFADDLVRVLRGEPVLARRRGRVGRVLGWVGRNRAASALLVTLAAGLVSSLLLSSRLSRVGREREVGELVAQAESHRFQHRTLEAYEAAWRARELAPDEPRTLARFMELLSGSRVTARIEMPSVWKGVATSPDGRWLGIAIGGAMEILAVDEPARAALRLDGVDGRQLVWTPDGEVIAVFADGHARRLRTDGSVVWETEVDLGEPGARHVSSPAVAVVADGAREVVYLGTYDGGLLRLDAASGVAVSPSRVEVGAGTIHCIARLPDRDLLLVTAELEPRHATVLAVDLRDGGARILGEHLGVATTLVGDENGFWASFAGRVRVLRVGRVDGEMPELEGLDAILGAESVVRSMALDHGKLALAVVDELVIFDLEAAVADERAEAVRLPHQGAISSVAFDPDGATIVTASSDGIARRWSADRSILGEILVQAPASQLLGVAVADTGRIFVIGSDGSVTVLDPPPGPFSRTRLSFGLAQLVPVWADVETVLVSRVGAGEIVTLDAESPYDLGRQAVQLHAERPTVEADRERTKFVRRERPTARFIAGAVDEPLLMSVQHDPMRDFIPVDPSTGMPWTAVRLPPTDATKIVATAASADARRVAVLRLHDLRRQPFTHISLLERGDDPAAWEMAGEQEQRDAPVQHLCFLPDGNLVLAGSEGGIRITDLADTRLLFRREDAPDAPARFVCVSPDGGHVLATFGDGGVFLIDVRTAEATSWPRGAAVVGFAVFSPDGRTAATGDATGELALWEVATGRLLCRWLGHEQRVEHLAFSPDGTRLASGSRDGTVATWPVDLADVDRLARSSRPRVSRVAGR